MAMGADHAVHVVHESAGAGAGALPPLAVARVLSAVVDHAGPFGMVLAGKQAIDGDNNQTGQMLAALRGWPQATFASSVSVTDGGTGRSGSTPWPPAASPTLVSATSRTCSVALGLHGHQDTRPH